MVVEIVVMMFEIVVTVFEIVGTVFEIEGAVSDTVVVVTDIDTVVWDTAVWDTVVLDTDTVFASLLETPVIAVAEDQMLRGIPLVAEGSKSDSGGKNDSGHSEPGMEEIATRGGGGGEEENSEGSDHENMLILQITQFQLNIGIFMIRGNMKDRSLLVEESNFVSNGDIHFMSIPIVIGQPDTTYISCRQEEYPGKPGVVVNDDKTVAVPVYTEHIYWTKEIHVKQLNE
ncbi:hypothetical protein LXL04_004094 [Taraxacum kok-saghyz]